jgi:hypothetical protein
MGKYFCPECSGISGVVETRISFARLKRRRSCQNGHRFTTVEVPHKAPKEINKLVDWLIAQGLNPEIGSYAKEQVGHILLGKPLEDGDEEEA